MKKIIKLLHATGMAIIIAAATLVMLAIFFFICAPCSYLWKPIKNLGEKTSDIIEIIEEYVTNLVSDFTKDDEKF